MSWAFELIGPVYDVLKGASKYAAKYYRSHKLLIVGQGASGKTSFYKFLDKSEVRNCKPYIRKTRDPATLRMFDLKGEENTVQAEIRALRDLPGQMEPSVQAKHHKQLRPHVLMIFLRGDIDFLDERDSPKDWLNEYFDAIGGQRQMWRKIKGLYFVITRLDQLPEGIVDRKKRDFRDLIEQNREKLHYRDRKNIQVETHFVKMCYCDSREKAKVRESLVNLRSATISEI